MPEADGGGVSVEQRVERFVREEFPALAGYCRLLTGDTSSGEDVAQEAMVRTWGRWTRVRHPRAYAYRVATNLALRRQTELTRLAPLEGTAVPLPADLSASDVAALRDLVERLPARHRTAVLLHYYADLPIETVARELRRPTGTVKRWLHEARTSLGASWREA